MEDTVVFILAVIVTESVTNLLTKAEIFLPLHEWLFNRRSNKLFNFIHRVLDCGYCSSVWVGFIVSFILLDFSYISPIYGWFIAGLVTHRLSNILHNTIDYFWRD